MKTSSLDSNLERVILEPSLSNLKQIIDSEILKLSSDLSMFKLNEQMSYAILSSGKRLRAMITLLCTGSVGGNLQNAKSLALAVEIMHAATLVHDDIVDKESIRRGKPTVHKKWSVNDAILTGDALLSLALSQIVNYDNKILQVISETGLLLAEGEYMDLDPSTETSEEEYIKRIFRKTASLFSASAKCGALVGKGSQAEIAALANFGENFGMAYQIRDDLQDTTECKGNIPADLRERRFTLPLIHMHDSTKEYEKSNFDRNIKGLAKKEYSNNQTYADEILVHLRQNGAIEYCQHKINEYVNEAINNLQLLQKTNYKTNLTQLAESLKLE